MLSTVATRRGRASASRRALVERGLAACVNVVPGVVSIYRWKGAVERERGACCSSSRPARDRFEALREALVALHPYEVPELLALPIEAGHAPYLAWLDEAVHEGVSGSAPSEAL